LAQSTVCDFQGERLMSNRYVQRENGDQNAEIERLLGIADAHVEVTPWEVVQLTCALEEANGAVAALVEGGNVGIALVKARQARAALQEALEAVRVPPASN
jgi:hypothetical protein